MTVLTLNQEDFHGACERLASQVHLTGFSPDLLVGIASGGLIVAHAVARVRFFAISGFVRFRAKENPPI